MPRLRPRRQKRATPYRMRSDGAMAIPVFKGPLTLGDNIIPAVFSLGSRPYVSFADEHTTPKSSLQSKIYQALKNTPQSIAFCKKLNLM